MTYNIKAWISSLAGLCLLGLSHVAPGADKTIWQGESGGLKILWTSEDIIATKGGKVLFSAKALARKDFEVEFLNSESESDSECNYERTFTLLSVVGTIASIKDMSYQYCRGAIRPLVNIQFTTVDLAKPDNMVFLTDLFPESVLIRALLADSVMKKVLAEAGITTPSTVDEFWNIDWTELGISARDSESGEECVFDIPGDFFARFAFHHLNKNQVAVRLGLSPARQICQSSHAQLGIYLPIPTALNSALKSARKGQAGILMNNLKKIAGKRNTTVRFATDTYTPQPETGTRVTIVPSVNFRSTPEFAANILETLEKGTVLKSLARSSFQEKWQQSVDYWYLVELETGKTGWVFGGVTHATDKASHIIWQGESGGLKILWTSGDIIATKGGKVLFSAKALARKDFEVEFLNSESESDSECNYERTFTLLSVVGTIASIKDMSYQYCRGAIRPLVNIQFTTVDLAKPDNMVFLTDLFPESVLIRALLADSVMKKVLAEAGITTPSTVDEFWNIDWTELGISARDSESGEECVFDIPGDFFARFAFHHLNKNQVAVRLGLSPARQICQSSHAQLGIYLPIPTALNSALKSARKGQAGILMNNLKKIAGKRNTTVRFATDTYTPQPETGTRVTIVPSVNFRSTPEFAANILETLEKGTVLKSLARSSFQEKWQQSVDYWYLVELETGKTGWVFGGVTHATDKARQTIWQGKSGGLNIHWTSADIIATKGDKVLFSAKNSLARKDFEEQFLEAVGTEPVCEYKRTFTLLSVVGTIASMKDTFEQHCQAATHGFPKLTTINLVQPDKAVSLTDFFQESVILKALLADSLIKKALAAAGMMTKHPTTLKALYRVLEEPGIVARDSEDGKKCHFQLSEDFLRQFAFHHINKNQVAVRLGLEPAIQSCQWSHAQLGIYLPIPTALQSALNNARKTQAGVLMGHLKQIAGGRNTIVHFATDSYLSKDTAQINTITVQRGDTLYRLARRYNHTAAELAAWNDLQPPYLLSLGETLLVNPPTKVSAPTKAPTDEATNDKPLYHIVAAGDTLYRVAKRYSQTVEKIAAWNDLQPPYDLSVGQKLRVSSIWTWTHKSTLHPALPEFVFKLVGKYIEYIEVKTIEIRRGNESQPFQTLNVSAEPPIYDDMSVVFIVEDVNFDGYRDIRLIAFPPWSNVVYVYWLFEPKMGRFVSSSAYNAAGLSSPTFNAENKQIISEWKAGCCLSGTDYYEVVDNKPVLVRQESYDQEKGLTVRERKL